MIAFVGEDASVPNLVDLMGKVESQRPCRQAAPVFVIVRLAPQPLRQLLVTVKEIAALIAGGFVEPAVGPSSHPNIAHIQVRELHAKKYAGPDCRFGLFSH